MTCQAEREAVAYIMRRLYTTRLTTTSGGNVSQRTPDGKIAITASQLDKAETRADQIALCTPEGENLTPELPISSETGMHLAIYQQCPEVSAIVHAHPTTACLFTASDEPIRIDLIAESYCMLGTVVKTPYHRTATDALAEAVAADAAAGAHCILMENHGITTVGKSLLQAFDRLELLESAAQMTLMARQLGSIRPLNDERKRELDALMGR